MKDRTRNRFVNGFSWRNSPSAAARPRDLPPGVEASVSQANRHVILLLCRCAMMMLTGCLAERSMPMRDSDLVWLDQHAHTPPVTSREWIRTFHEEFQHKLPFARRRAMLAEDMVDSKGRPVDAYMFMNENSETLTSIFTNLRGTLYTAQAVGSGLTIDEAPPEWKDFEDIRIPVTNGATLCARIGFAGCNGRRISSPCIVLLPGFFGDNGILRTRDLAFALRRAGFHVLAIELQGHGQTERHFPDSHYTFGAIEAQDLLHVSGWLEDSYHCISETGLVGVCWGGNLGLLAAWYDGAASDHPSILPELRMHLHEQPDRRHFTAGVIAFSPVIGWEEVLDRTDAPHTFAEDPFTHFFQNTIRSRMERKGYPEASGSLRHLIAYEYRHSVLGQSLPIEAGYRFLRLLPYHGLPAGDKLESARVPVLIVLAVNDPFINARNLPELIARTGNPAVAALLLRDGGHTGFAPFSRSYYFSLVANFFRDASQGRIARPD